LANPASKTPRFTSESDLPFAEELTVTKTGVSLALICLCGILRAQTPLSQDEALKQMYGNYDPTANGNTFLH
jgi:hypothetical protein